MKEESSFFRKTRQLAFIVIAFVLAFSIAGFKSIDVKAADTAIPEIKLEFDKRPVSGNVYKTENYSNVCKLVFEDGMPETCEITSLRWYKGTSTNEEDKIPDDEKFVEGETYNALLVIQAKEGYKWDKTAAIVNKGCVRNIANPYGKTLFVEVSFVAENTAIPGIKLKFDKRPIAGNVYNEDNYKKACGLVFESEAPETCEITDVRWYKGKSTQDKDKIPNNEVFVEGETYNAHIILQTIDDFKWDKASGALKTEVSVNKGTIWQKTNPYNNVLFVDVVFEAENTAISGIKLSFDKIPVAGNTFKTSDYSNACKLVFEDGVPETCEITSLRWYKGTSTQDKDKIKDNEEFVEGETYNAHFVIQPKGDYKWDKTSGTLKTEVSVNEGTVKEKVNPYNNVLFVDIIFVAKAAKVDPTSTPKPIETPTTPEPTKKPEEGTPTPGAPTPGAVTPAPAKVATPTPTASPTPTQAPVPEEGTDVIDSKADAVYTVVSKGKTDTSNTASNENPTIEYKCSENPNVKKLTIPDTVTIDGITYDVVGVAPKALKGRKKLTSVTIGAKVKYIGNSAFENCPSLKTVNCKSKVLEKIGSKAFNKDKKLVKITLKTTKLKAKKVGKNAIKGTSSKLVIKVPKKVKKSYLSIFKTKGNKTVKTK